MWQLFQDYLRQRKPIQGAANRCEISYRTAFLLRHRFLADALTLEPLCDMVEMDEAVYEDMGEYVCGAIRHRQPIQTVFSWNF